MSVDERLLRLIDALCRELGPGRPPARLDSHLERALGLDSLARAELLLRCEAEFGLRLPQRLLGEAETPRDFFLAIEEAEGRGGREQEPAMPTSAQPVAAATAATTEPAPDDLDTLGEVFAWHAARQPDFAHIVHLDDEGKAEALSFGRLWREARAVAAGLQAREIAPGDAVALMLPTCPAFFPCFLGILLAGAVPVPIYPPARPSQIEDHLRRHATILANAGARLLIATAEVALPASLLRGRVESLRGTVLADELIAAASEFVPVPARADQLALLQYTSGSTGNPKGVMLSHGQLLANIRAMARAARIERDDVFVSWLPLYHDMGLICAWLSSLVYAIPFVVMSPLSFLAAPERWLRAIHDYRGTFSGAPNFAYELCLRRIAPERLAGLDLSSWRIAFNGAEPVNADTMARFIERFAPCGLRPEAVAPVYGLAECAVGLAFTKDRGLVVDRIERESFVAHGIAVPAPAASDALRFVACGRPLPGYEIRVVDGAGAELPERREGRLQFRGPSATAGYFRNPAATAELIRGDWLDSGDYAYLAGGEVYPTGRAKDIIIKGGRNVYPQEVEEAVGRVPGIRAGCVAVFGSPDPASGTERLVVAAEARAPDDALRLAVQEAVVGVLGMPADDVVLSAQRIVLKTSSGKIRRAASRELYEGGGGVTAPRAVWWQVTRLLAGGLLPQLRRGMRAAAGWLHGLWAAGSFLLLAVVVWLVVAVVPRPRHSWRFCHAAARIWLRLAGIRLEVSGLENLPRDGTHVLVVNHASYLDGIAFVAALPFGGWRFVAKRELAGGFVPRIFLQRLGVEFVERFDFAQGVADTERLVEAVVAGHSLAVFPEGTFTRVPGLRPFRMGAFVVAAKTATPVVPVALSGTRDVLREGHWLPRRGRLRVTVGESLVPDGSDWNAAVRLRDGARSAILKGVGEPDLQA
ncbi:AMP-binding protein [Sulfurisoma sediminicola]|uniref:1-acyl-sn-glycerol-3-phosphate acyltransferase n=1 Tax=Sulfurisoma sediminicola TaxID=1381557 RepID=A0A497XEQ0_9PROT|nr:AMP-binding protein [Sulfurisoma sediminicola]RLJ65156.1 1-acyl-sn-glycerol-3-phosphate acyltransferase [Sulfurisoma sediminicola]